MERDAGASVPCEVEHLGAPVEALDIERSREILEMPASSAADVEERARIRVDALDQLDDLGRRGRVVLVGEQGVVNCG